MFLTPGLVVLPSQLSSVAVKGTVLAFVLVVVARPVAVAVAPLPFAYNRRDQLILGGPVFAEPFRSCRPPSR